MNVTEVIRKTGKRFGDSANVMILQADFIDFINEAQLQILRETNILTGSTTGAAYTAFLTGLALPTDLIEILRVLYNGIPLPKIEIESIDALGINVADHIDGPTYYYLVNNTMKLYPGARSGDTTVVTVEYSKTPAQIATTADPLTVPIVYHEDVVDWCVMRCHEVNQNYKAQEIALQEFHSNVGNRLDEAKVRDGTYPTIRDDPWDDF